MKLFVQGATLEALPELATAIQEHYKQRLDKIRSTDLVVLPDDKRGILNRVTEAPYEKELICNDYDAIIAFMEVGLHPAITYHRLHIKNKELARLINIAKGVNNIQAPNCLEGNYLFVDGFNVVVLDPRLHKCTEWVLANTKFVDSSIQGIEAVWNNLSSHAKDGFYVVDNKFKLYSVQLSACKTRVERLTAQDWVNTCNNLIELACAVKGRIIRVGAGYATATSYHIGWMSTGLHCVIKRPTLLTLDLLEV